MFNIKRIDQTKYVGSAGVNFNSQQTLRVQTMAFNDTNGKESTAQLQQRLSVASFVPSYY